MRELLLRRRLRWPRPSPDSAAQAKPSDPAQPFLIDNTPIDPEQQQFLDGSPRIALDLQFPFSSYVFIEQDPDRVEASELLQVEYQRTHNIRIEPGDCTAYLRDKLAQINKSTGIETVRSYSSIPSGCRSNGKPSKS